MRSDVHQCSPLSWQGLSSLSCFLGSVFRKDPFIKGHCVVMNEGLKISPSLLILHVLKSNFLIQLILQGIVQVTLAVTEGTSLSPKDRLLHPLTLACTQALCLGR